MRSDNFHRSNRFWPRSDVARPHKPTRPSSRKRSAQADTFQHIAVRKTLQRSKLFSTPLLSLFWVLYQKQ